MEFVESNTSCLLLSSINLLVERDSQTSFCWISVYHEMARSFIRHHHAPTLPATPLLPAFTPTSHAEPVFATYRNLHRMQQAIDVLPLGYQLCGVALYSISTSRDVGNVTDASSFQRGAQPPNRCPSGWHFIYIARDPYLAVALYGKGFFVRRSDKCV